MTIVNQTQLQNTRAKLKLLEERHAELKTGPADNAATRNLTLQSLEKRMKKLKEGNPQVRVPNFIQISRTITRTGGIFPNQRSAGVFPPSESNIQRVQRIHQLVQVVLGLLGFVGLAFGDADGEADGLAAVVDQFSVAFLSGDLDGVGAAEKLAQIDLESADGPSRSASDGGRFVLRKDDGVLRANPTARRAATLAVVLILHQDALILIDAVDPKQAKIDALHAVGAATVVDHRIPAPVGRSEEVFGSEATGGRLSFRVVNA